MDLATIRTNICVVVYRTDSKTKTAHISPVDRLSYLFFAVLTMNVSQ